MSTDKKNVRRRRQQQRRRRLQFSNESLEKHAERFPLARILKADDVHICVWKGRDTQYPDDKLFGMFLRTFMYAKNTCNETAHYNKTNVPMTGHLLKKLQPRI